MKNLKDLLVINESLSDKAIEDFQNRLNTNEDYQGIIKRNIATLNEQILKRAGGYIVEAKVKEWVSATAEMDTKVYEDGNTWYDFTYEGQNFEIKAFLKGKKYSNTKLTANQLEHKNDLAFLLCEYEIDGSELKINSIEVVNGKDLKISGNRMVKK